MLHVPLPDNLLEQIEAAGVAGSAVDEFVEQAVREKLHEEERRKEFHRLTAKIREAMSAKGLTEEEVLADFEEQRRKPMDDVLNDFDALCERAAVCAPGTHLTRDQLHERD